MIKEQRDNEKTIGTTETREYCSAYYFKPDMSVRATADASLIGDEWWLNRVVIAPKAQQGKGLGGKLLEKLKKVVAGAGGKFLLVAPGGYTTPYEMQVRFYRKHGFKDVIDPERKGVLRVELNVG